MTHEERLKERAEEALKVVQTTYSGPAHALQQYLTHLEVRLAELGTKAPEAVPLPAPKEAQAPDSSKSKKRW